jgi:peptidoglycan/xylan/chitin deacetylase (PgdA/CDA1 family)
MKYGCSRLGYCHQLCNSVTTTLKTVTFPKVQEQVKVKNQGNANLTYTIGSQSGALTPGQSVTVNESISSFTIQAASGTQAFELRAKEKGTEQTETETDVMSLLAEIPNLTNYEISSKSRKGQAIISFVSDDGFEADYSILKNIFQPRNVPCVLAAVPNLSGEMSDAHLLELQNMGWEISSHTADHKGLNPNQDATSVLNNAEIDYQLKESKRLLESKGLKITTICYPYGQYNDLTKEYARKYYRCARKSSLGSGINVSPIDSYALNTVFMDGLTTPNQVVFPSLTDSTQTVTLTEFTYDYYKYFIDKAILNNGWCIISLHAAYLAEFTSAQQAILGQLLDYIATTTASVKTLNDALNQIGNIVDIGNYPNKDYFVIGADGKVYSSMLKPLNTLVNATNSADNSTLIGVFENFKITQTPITNSNATGFPNNTAGVLITDKTAGENGYNYQLYHVYNSNDIYKRGTTSTGVWKAWQKINLGFYDNATITSDLNAFSNASVNTSFVVGKVTYTKINTAGGNNVGFPNNASGTLITDRVANENGYDYQMYHPYNSNEVWKRGITSAGVWKAWQKISVGFYENFIQFVDVNTYTNATALSSFTTGKITYCNNKDWKQSYFLWR